MIQHYGKKVTKRLTWSKDGWKKSNNLGNISCRSFVDSALGERDKFTSDNPEVDMYLEARDKIQIGGCQDAMDQLPTGMKYLINNPYEWYFSDNGKLFRAVDQETQAKGAPELEKRAEWGYDSEERAMAQDPDSAPPSICNMLEQYGIFPPRLDNVQEEDLDYLTDQENRVYIDISRLGRSQFGTVIDDEEFADDEDFSEEEDTVKVNYYPIAKSFQLSPKVQDQLDAIFNRAIRNVDLAQTAEEKEQIRTEVEKEVTKVAYHEIVNRLDSPWCAKGYTAPKVRWDHIWNPNNDTSQTDAAEARDRRFWRFVDKITKCKNMDQLFGKIQYTEDGPGRDGGVCAELRRLSTEDKDLLEAWSSYDRYDTEGNLVQKSALTIEKESFYEKMRSKGKDEETIRKMAWHKFDREAKKTPPVYENKKLTVERKSISDSPWKASQKEAFKELNFTSAQRSSLWDLVKAMKKKFKQADNLELKDRINKAFAAVKTLDNMKVFKQWLYNRKCGYIETTNKEGKVFRKKNYKLTPAIIDRLSISQTKKIEAAINRKEKKLTKQLKHFRHLEVISEGIPELLTNEPKTEAECYLCGRWLHDSPRLAIINPNTTYKFIPCDCGKKVWINE